MSAEETATGAVQKPVDQNAESAEDAKRMLAELQGGAASNGSSEEKKQNGTAETETKIAEKKEGDGAEVEKPVEREDRHPDRRHHDRSDRGGRGRGRGRGGHPNTRNFRDNIKSDLTTQEESSDPVAIRKQVEFYFSDSNLPNDKFLFNKVGGSANNAVELKVLHSFKRMRHFQPFEAIVEAMKESKFLELTDDDTCVRRREPLPEIPTDAGDVDAIKVFEDRAMPRSVYVKGFGEEVPSTQFDIEAFFAPHGPTNAVRLRRSDTKIFKGSVFVEFENEDLQKAFLALDPKPQYQGKDLQIMSKKEYCDKKVDDIKSGKIRANRSFEHKSRGGGDRRGGGGRDFKRKRDNEDDRDWRDRRDQDRKNGFRDDKRRSQNDRDSRGGKPWSDKVEKDERGVPVVKTTTDEEAKSKRDAARADALAKAKAIVEAENKKNVEKDKEGPAEPAAGAKRAREDDEAETERAAKKVDAKVEVDAVNGS